MSTNTARRPWSGEEGIALILAMFMVLVVSLIGASLATVGRTETLSSLNYKTMSQARYAAESGLHGAANYLIHVYVPPGADAADPVTGVYDLTKSPVEYNGDPVVLTTAEGAESNYPIKNKVTTFEADAAGDLAMSNTKASYTATATLLSMRRFTDAYSGGQVTIQTWQITGIGQIKGAGAADVEVSAIIETQRVPAYRYAAFATFDGCDAMTFGGGGQSDSYDSSKLVGGNAVTSKSDGNVGTNGGLTMNGATKTTIYGTLSTPRTGVGNCTDASITALDISGKADVKDGLVQLPQAVHWNTPAAIAPAPPTTALDFKKTGGCPAAAPKCTAVGDVMTITPDAGVPVQMGNVTMNALAEVHLNAGTYEVNTLSIAGNAKVYIDSGPVIFKVNGLDATGAEIATPIDVNGGGVLNNSLNPQNLQFVYGGSGEVKLNGGSKSAFLGYAPNATVNLNGNADIYGAIVGKFVNDTGGAKLHFDLQLKSWAYTEGEPTMTSFTWSSTH